MMNPETFGKSERRRDSESGLLWSGSQIKGLPICPICASVDTCTHPQSLLFVSAATCVTFFRKMGLLAEGHTLTWENSKEVLEYVSLHGVQQFLAIYHEVKNRERDCLFWGDEVRNALYLRL